MRISDWSSDVCSSDLGKAKTAEAAPPRSTPPAPVADPCAGLSGARAVQCRADTRALDRRCGGPNPQKTAECLAYAKARTGAEPAKAVERHWVQIEIGRAHVELQSLMRISYAVFRLK